MITLRRSGLRKVMEGVTTIEEVARETVKYATDRVLAEDNAMATLPELLKTMVELRLGPAPHDADAAPDARARQAADARPAARSARPRPRRSPTAC